MTILDDIIAYKREEVVAAKAATSTSVLETLIAESAAPRSFLHALERDAADGFALIAEIKKASPSKGMIREDFSPDQLAKAYEAGGATCISVLTDGPSFQGSPVDLRKAKAACNLPVLRKDFMIDPYQVHEARAWGADCILLIMSVLDVVLATELEEAAIELGLSVLIECHDEKDVDKALVLKSKLIGINNRNLRTFDTSLSTTYNLAATMPKDRFLISESGIKTHKDLINLTANGAKGFLVGETLMRNADVEKATRALLTGNQ